MLKLKLQYFGHLTQRANLLEKTLMLGKIEGRRGQQRMRWLDSISNSMELSLNELQEMVKHLPAMWETWVWSLCWEDPLEKEVAPHSSTLAWKIPWTEPLSLPYVNWISQEGCLLHLRFSFQSSDLPLIYFHGLFPFFVFYPPLFWLLFPLLTA